MDVAVLKKSMVAVGVVTSALAIRYISSGNLTLGIIQVGATLMAVFLYHNPQALLAKNAREVDDLVPKFKAPQFLWSAIALGCLAIVTALER
ncbi:MAG: hypothetical protein HOC23_22660 [Halieaceae bacterium]|nr:hypothetical protein [Halieaceae bacterium]